MIVADKDAVLINLERPGDIQSGISDDVILRPVIRIRESGERPDESVQLAVDLRDDLMTVALQHHLINVFGN